jgi:hypothetical protein
MTAVQPELWLRALITTNKDPILNGKIFLKWVFKKGMGHGVD